MITQELSRTLTTLLSELVDGAPSGGAFILNGGDIGLLRSLDRLSAADASTPSSGGATIAAHVDHVRYGLSLMNRWCAGENPFEDADWGAAWRTGAVSDASWQRLREDLAREAHQWIDALATPREANEIELNGVVASVAHLAYHLGALRQIDRTLRGPREGERSATT